MKWGSWSILRVEDMLSGIKTVQEMTKEWDMPLGLLAPAERRCVLFAWMTGRACGHTTWTDWHRIVSSWAPDTAPYECHSPRQKHPDRSQLQQTQQIFKGNVQFSTFMHVSYLLEYVMQTHWLHLRSDWGHYMNMYFSYIFIYLLLNQTPYFSQYFMIACMLCLWMGWS